MLVADIPTKFPIPWADQAGASFIRDIPVDSQIGIVNGQASLTDGFPPLNFSPIVAGGVPPFGQDFNGILKQITQWNQWQQAGGPIFWDEDFATDIGGYPKGAVVSSNLLEGTYWLNQADGNSTDPDDPLTTANWVTPPNMLGTGAIQWRPFTFSNSNTYKWLRMNATTIGNAVSGATYAAADAMFLFIAFWNGFSNAQCPVSTGRGASGFADFAAGKTITLPDMRGLAVASIDTMGGSVTTLLNGVPTVIGNSTTHGSILGANLHTLTLAEIIAHTHGVTDPSHVHGVTDPSHIHGVTDPTHGHLASTGSTFGGSGVTGVGTGGSGPGASPVNLAGVSTTAALTGVSVNGALTGVSINAALTGISTQSAGGSGAHNNAERIMLGEWLVKL